MKHVTFGSSTAARTTQCPAWVKLSEGIPRAASQAAVDGDIIHQILDRLNNGVEPADLLDATEEHLDLAYQLFAASERVLDNYDVVETFPEQFLEFAPDVGGTLDLVGMTEDQGVVVLLDYKTGKGVQVEAQFNSQILFCAAILYHHRKAYNLPESAIVMGVIIQPDRDGEIQTRQWQFTWGDAMAWWDSHVKAIEAAREGGQKPNPGDHCKFCPAAPLCPAKTGAVKRAKELDPANQAELVELLDMADDIRATLKEAEKLAKEQLDQGVKLPGYKLVYPRKNRAWADLAEATAAARKALHGTGCANEVLDIKLKSPAQVEKVLKKYGRIDRMPMEELAPRKEATETVIAREDDPRPAVLPTAALSEALAAIN